MSFTSRFLFLKKLFKQPKVNASVTPSSRYLARAMINGIDFSICKTVVEFGPGTGVFTKLIIDHVPKTTKILCIEFEQEYVTMLTKKFGNRIVIEHGDVHDIKAILHKHDIDVPDVIISGLPYHIYDVSLMKHLHEYITQGTIFRGFSYMPHQLRDIYKELPLVQKDFVLRNIPPAFVFGAN